MRLATLVDRPLMRLSRGRLRLSFVIPLVLLRARGARSGKTREVPLLCVPEADGLLLVGSGGGSEREPAWCANLRAHPEVECVRSGRRGAFTAAELSGAPRADAWRRACEIYPGYPRYQARLERLIPVFRLTPTSGRNRSSGAGRDTG